MYWPLSELGSDETMFEIWILKILKKKNLLDILNILKILKIWSSLKGL